MCTWEHTLLGGCMQGLANKWVRAMEKERGLLVIKLTGAGACCASGRTRTVPPACYPLFHIPSHGLPHPFAPALAVGACSAARSS